MSSSEERKILERAARSAAGPRRTEDLADEGITIGPWEEVDQSQLFEAVDGEEVDSRPLVRLLVFSADSRNQDRTEVSDLLSDFVEQQGLGEWVGGGQGAIDDAEFFDVIYAVEDLAAAVPPILTKVRELGAGPSTEISELTSPDEARYYTLDGGSLETPTF